MISIKEIRQKYPSYNDLSDQELADALYKKHYSDMPIDEYYSKIGLDNFDDSQYATNEKPIQDEGIIKNLGRGLLRGAGQTLGDIGASVLNYPIEKLESFTGKQIPHIPHPNLINQEPTGLAETIGQNVGQLGASFAIPFGAAGRVAKLLKSAPGLVRGLGAAGTGALEGYLGSEDNRKLGGVTGGLIGGAATAIPALVKAGKAYTSEGIAKDIIKRFNKLKKEYNVKYDTLLEKASEEAPTKKLKSTLVNRDLFIKGGFNKDLHALDKFNQNPTLENAHRAQSALGSIARESKAKGGDLNFDISKSANIARDNLKNQIIENLQKIKNKKYHEEYKQLSENYKKDVVPYLESPTITKLTTKKPNKLHPRYAYKGLINEEETLSALGQHHPKLRQREILENVMKNTIVQNLLKYGALGGTGAYVAKHF